MILGEDIREMCSIAAVVLETTWNIFLQLVYQENLVSPRYRWEPAEYDNIVSVPLPFSKVSCDKKMLMRMMKVVIKV